MARIKTGEDFIKEAIRVGYNPQENWTLDKWDEQIQERFDTNEQIYNLRVTDITEKSMLGGSANSYGAIKLMNRLDNIIENETDPIKKATAMAVRHVGFPECNSIIENNIIESIKSFRDEIINNPENTVSPKAIEEFDERVKKSNEAVSGLRNVGNTIDPNTVNYEQLPANEQLDLVQTLINSFMDSTICRDANGNVLHENKAMKQLLERVNNCAKNIVGKIEGKRSANFKPADDREKSDYEALSKQVKAMNAEKKAEFAHDVTNFNTLELFANIDVTPRFDKAVLKLDKSPLFSTTAEAFVEKQKNRTLSNIELEWGESNVDHMVESLYTPNELKILKLAGIDPAMGILVDGKPLDWYTEATPTFLTSAKNKCEIVSKAMQGSKIDVAKFVPDGRGGYKTGSVVPVKTDLSMKTEKRSIWTILKQLFGFVVTLKDKVNQANKQGRNYLSNDKDENTVSAAKRSAEVLQVKDKDYKNDELYKNLDVDFFGDVYPSNGTIEKRNSAISQAIKEDYHYSDSNNIIKPIIDNLDRHTTRTNLAILYGLTKGHTFEEMMADTPEGKNLRKQTGKDFVEEFKVCSLDEYAKKNELDANSQDTRERYNKFVLDKIQNVEKVCARSCEEFVKLPLSVPDVNDRAEFLADYDMLNQLSVMAKDFSQGYKTLGINSIAPTDESAIKVHERTSAVYDYISSQIEPVMKLGIPMGLYSSYITSNSYAEAKNLSEITVDRAAKSKAFFSFFKEKGDEINTIADLNNNKDLCMEIYALTSVIRNGLPEARKEIYDRVAEYYLPSSTPAFNTVLIDSGIKQINMFGHISYYGDVYNKAKVIADGFTKGMEEFDKHLDETQRNLSISEKIEAIKAVQANMKSNEKQTAHKEKISLSELVGNKASVTAKPKETAVKEKSLDIGGVGK